MRRWRHRLLTCLVCLSLFISSCGETVSESRIFQADESAQAAVDEPAIPAAELRDAGSPVKGLSPEDVERTRQAQETQNPEPVNCDEPGGRIEQPSYPGYLSGDLIPVRVYLPPCYDPYLHVYPVIFLLHGKPQNEQHWLLLGVDDVITDGIIAGKWPPLVLVMPLQPEPLFSETAGGPGSLEQEAMDGLVPFILDRYAITGEAEQWAIAGISRGGVWALEIGLRHPERFRRIAALSPALNVNYTLSIYDPVRILGDAVEVPEGIFFGVGNLDSAKNKTLEFVSRVEAKGIPHAYLEVEGTHESTTWVRLIPNMLEFLTRGW